MGTASGHLSTVDGVTLRTLLADLEGVRDADLLPQQRAGLLRRIMVVLQRAFFPGDPESHADWVARFGQGLSPVFAETWGDLMADFRSTLADVPIYSLKSTGPTKHAAKNDEVTSDRKAMTGKYSQRKREALEQEKKLQQMQMQMFLLQQQQENQKRVKNPFLGFSASGATGKLATVTATNHDEGESLRTEPAKDQASNENRKAKSAFLRFSASAGAAESLQTAYQEPSPARAATIITRGDEGWTRLCSCAFRVPHSACASGGRWGRRRRPGR